MVAAMVAATMAMPITVIVSDPSLSLTVRRGALGGVSLRPSGIRTGGGVFRLPLMMLSSPEDHAVAAAGVRQPAMWGDREPTRAQWKLAVPSSPERSGGPRSAGSPARTGTLRRTGYCRSGASGTAPAQAT